MDNQTAIEIAESVLRARNVSFENYRANVVNPYQRIVEVVFSKSLEQLDPGQTPHRLYLTQFHDFFSIIPAMGTPLETPPPSALTWVRDEAPIEAATRFLEAHGIDTASLEPKLVEPRSVAVWYDWNDEEERMGGLFTVYMTEAGDLIRVTEDQ